MTRLVKIAACCAKRQDDRSRRARRSSVFAAEGAAQVALAATRLRGKPIAAAPADPDDAPPAGDEVAPSCEPPSSESEDLASRLSTSHGSEEVISQPTDMDELLKGQFRGEGQGSMLPKLTQDT